MKIYTGCLLGLACFLGGGQTPELYALESMSDAGSMLDTLKLMTQNARITGSVRGDYFQSSKSLDDEANFFGSTLQLKALPGFSDKFDAKFEWRATNAAVGESGQTRDRVLEAYGTLHFRQADLSVGKRSIAWGRADGINPTDNLTPRDFTVQLPYEEDQRFGSSVVKLDVFLTQFYTLSAIILPRFEPSRLPRPAQTGFTAVTPARTIANSGVGVKLDQTGQGLDWSVSYFRGHNLLPTGRLVEQPNAVPQAVFHYDPIEVVGADFARNFGRFGVRAELAYIDTADNAGTDTGVSNPSIFWVAGVDRTFFTKLNVNLQFLQRRVHRYQDPAAIADPATRAIATQNALIHGQEDRYTHGLSLRISDAWLHDTLTAEVFTIMYFKRENSFLRPLVSYTFSDHWRGALGGEYYFGDPDTRFGSVKANRGIFAELNYAF